MVKEQLEHVISFQGAEIRKYIRNELDAIYKAHNIDMTDVENKISKLLNLLSENDNEIDVILGLVNGNKQSIAQSETRLKAFISENISLLDNNITNKMNTGISDVVNLINTEITNVSNKFNASIQKQEENNKINTSALCEIFSKSLWDYKDYILIREQNIGKGKNKLFIKFAGDHYNTSSVAYDVSKYGSPHMRITVNGKVVYNEFVKAVKIFNQFETLSIFSDEDLESINIEFVQDAWEGGSDANTDGLSEDRNLWTFDIKYNEVDIREAFKYKVGSEFKDYRESMPWQGSLVFPAPVRL